MESTGDAAAGISATCANSSQRGTTALPELAQTDSLASLSGPLIPWLLSSLLSIAVLLFLGFSWSRYRATNPASDSSFRVGTTQSVEITLIRDDVRNLACASKLRVGELRCGFDAGRTPIQGLAEPQTLRPYNTVKSELLLVAGLWSTLPAREKLPRARFTVVCDFHVTGVVKSASLRWAPDGKFEPLERSVPVGLVEHCEIPP